MPQLHTLTRNPDGTWSVLRDGEVVAEFDSWVDASNHAQELSRRQVEEPSRPPQSPSTDDD